LVADATLFLILFIFGFTQWCSYEYVRHTLFCLGLCCGRFLKLTGSLFAVELRCCDCVEIKVSRGNVPFPTLGLEPMSIVHISVALVAQHLNVRQLKGAQV
jgi:hypothetical protein